MSTSLSPRRKLAAGLLATLLPAGGALTQTGVVVEAVPRGGAGELAGLRPGDVLLTWTRAAAPPANPEPAASLTAVMQQRGSIEGEAFGERAVAIAEHLGRESAALGALINLGDAKAHRGDLEGAEMVLRRADEPYQRVGPESRRHAFMLNNLGEALASRGDWESAEALFSRTLRIFEVVGRTDFEMAQVVANVARADLALRRLDSAKRRLQQARELHEKSFAGSPAHAHGRG